jgi:hypothetical protein
MMDDPVLLYGTAGVLVFMPLCSNLLSKWKLTLIFAIPTLSLLVSLPMFLFVVIVPTIPVSRYLFYASMILWTGGLFTLFYSVVVYRHRRRA